jgi:hypothetical protein
MGLLVQSFGKLYAYQVARVSSEIMNDQADRHAAHAVPRRKVRDGLLQWRATAVKLHQEKLLEQRASEAVRAREALTSGPRTSAAFAAAFVSKAEFSKLLRRAARIEDAVRAIKEENDAEDDGRGRGAGKVDMEKCMEQLVKLREHINMVADASDRSQREQDKRASSASRRR